MNIVVVGSEGCLGSGFMGLVDILWLARRAIADQTCCDTPFTVTTASMDGSSVQDGHGRRFEVQAALSDIEACQALIVPGFVPDESGYLPPLASLASSAAWIRQQHARGALVCGSCSGVFLLGEARLLDGRRCTTTWWLHDEMKSRYPRADAVWGATIVEDARVVTAGGPLSWIDLALHVVRSLCGRDAARIAADFAVVDTSPSTQAAYTPPGYLAASSSFLVQAEHAVRQGSTTSLTARDLAQLLSTSERTLHRRLRKASGEAPSAFIRRVRLEMARTALELGTRSIKHVALSSGYLDETSFRRAFRQFSGMTPGAFRRLSRTKHKPS